jgi:N-acetylglucosaminyldiphosphoundecaprenol N-acetyl-beta-D-mannosaminyltransferase
VESTTPTEAADRTSTTSQTDLEPSDRVTIWGLPLARLTCRQTVEAVERLIERGQPSFFITANLHYAMLSDRDPRLRTVNDRAAFLVADGMPLVWYARLTGRRMPERVTGADLIYLLCERAAQRGHRVFFLGAGPGVAEAAAAQLGRRYPGLHVVGTEAPVLEELSADQHAALIARIRQARPDLLLVAFGQPKGELWLAENCQAIGAPAAVQLGATFDFVVGRIPRAPRWLQRIGLEWLYRALREPRRLAPRYFRDAVFLVRAVLRDIVKPLARSARRERASDS